MLFTTRFCMRGAKRLLFATQQIVANPEQEDNVSLAGGLSATHLDEKLNSQGMFSYVYAISAYRRFTRRTV
ncbi:hypothetical protein ACP0HM_25985 [Escherichia coli]